MIALMTLTALLMIKLSITPPGGHLFENAYAAQTVQYQYKVVEIEEKARQLSPKLVASNRDLERILNRYGKEGWEYSGTFPGPFGVDVVFRK